MCRRVVLVAQFALKRKRQASMVSLYLHLTRWVYVAERSNLAGRQKGTADDGPEDGERLIAELQSE